MGTKKKVADLEAISSFGLVRIAGYDGGGLPPVAGTGGKKGQVITEIKKLYGQMRDAAKVENYERAAELRDKIRELAKDLGKSFN